MPPGFPLAFSPDSCYPTLTAPSPPGGGGAFTPCRQAFKDAGRALFLFFAWLRGPGHPHPAPGHSLRRLDGHRGPGGTDRGSAPLPGEPDPARLLFAALLLIGIIGLKATA